MYNFILLLRTSFFVVVVSRLLTLYRRDEEKKANEQARNALESHVFETKDAMYSDAVMEVSTEEQREVITTALNEVGDWMEDDGYIADTKVCVCVCVK